MPQWLISGRCHAAQIKRSQKPGTLMGGHWGNEAPTPFLVFSESSSQAGPGQLKDVESKQTTHVKFPDIFWDDNNHLNLF